MKNVSSGFEDAPHWVKAIIKVCVIALLLEFALLILPPLPPIFWRTFGGAMIIAIVGSLLVIFGSSIVSGMFRNE